MGPLGKLWNSINSIKDNSNPDQVIDIDVLMKHADQAVLLLGQTINSVSYNRRFAALGDIMKDSRDVKRCLKDKKDVLQQEGERGLFGKKFRKHIEDVTKTRKKSKEAIKQYSSPSSSKTNQPFSKGGPPARNAQNFGGKRLYHINTSGRDNQAKYNGGNQYKKQQTFYSSAHLLICIKVQQFQ